jgi:hypothetical protein
MARHQLLLYILPNVYVELPSLIPLLDDPILFSEHE